MDYTEIELQNEVSKRVFDLIDPWDRDDSKSEDEQINDIFNEISTHPTYTIRFLLDIIDNLQG